MAIERTLAIIKPDAVGRGLSGEILARIHKAGFQIVAVKSMRLTRKEAEGFYAVHRERGFFGELTDFIAGAGNGQGPPFSIRDLANARREFAQRLGHVRCGPEAKH